MSLGCWGRSQELEDAHSGLLYSSVLAPRPPFLVETFAMDMNGSLLRPPDLVRLELTLPFADRRLLTFLACFFSLVQQDPTSAL